MGPKNVFINFFWKEKKAKQANWVVCLVVLLVCEIVHPQTNIKSRAGPRPWFINDESSWKPVGSGAVTKREIF